MEEQKVRFDMPLKKQIHENKRRWSAMSVKLEVSCVKRIPVL